MNAHRKADSKREHTPTFREAHHPSWPIRGGLVNPDRIRNWRRRDRTEQECLIFILIIVKDTMICHFKICHYYSGIVSGPRSLYVSPYTLTLLLLLVPKIFILK